MPYPDHVDWHTQHQSAVVTVLCMQNAHNVLVASSSVAPHGLVAKVADLGLSRVLKQHATHRTTRTVSGARHTLFLRMSTAALFSPQG
jgi:hypothetical protein